MLAPAATMCDSASVVQAGYRCVYIKDPRIIHADRVTGGDHI